MTPKLYPVFIVRSVILLRDPDMPPGRLHHALFVETDPSRRSGFFHHVVGDITSRGGMTYQAIKTDDPCQLETFHSQEFLGYTDPETHPDQWDAVLRSLPTPPQQKAGNPSRQGKVEPFKQKLGDFSYVFYADGEERRPLWKCTEWTGQYAVPELKKRGLVKDGDQGSVKGQASS